jgi:hypothetical protein
MNRIIGLCGYARSGKDTAAEGLIEIGWTRVALADPLKRVALAIGWDGEKDEPGRVLLQNLGQAVREHIAPDAWITALLTAAERVHGDVVVTDVRYPNEAAAIRDQGGYLVQIVRPGVGPANEHASEDVAALHPEFVLRNAADAFAIQGQLVDLVEGGACDECGAPACAAAGLCPRCGQRTTV